jgi:hypothetical protein
MPCGELSLSQKVVMQSALPSPSVSMQSLTRARPMSRLGWVLYSSSPTKSFPSGETQMLAGLLMAGASTNVLIANSLGTLGAAGPSAASPVETKSRASESAAKIVRIRAYSQNP